MKVAIYIFVPLCVICFIPQTTLADSVNLTFWASETYAYAYAWEPMGGPGGEFDTYEQTALFPRVHWKIEGQAVVQDIFSDSPKVYEHHSYTQVNVDLTSDSLLASNLKGAGGWSEMWPLEEGYGGGDGSAWISAFGSVNIDYPEGASDLILTLDVEIIGDSSSSWDNSDWWFKVCAGSPAPGATLLQLNDNNMTANLGVWEGRELSFKFYHEAAKNNWPETGLSSTVKINASLVPEPSTLLLLGFGTVMLREKRRT